MKKLTALLICNSLLLVPLAAQAYVGPGAGLSLLGALWALVLALGTALVFVLAWPIKRLLRHRREAQLHDDDSFEDDPAAVPQTETVRQQPHK